MSTHMSASSFSMVVDAEPSTASQPAVMFAANDCMTETSSSSFEPISR